MPMRIRQQSLTAVPDLPEAMRARRGRVPRPDTEAVSLGRARGNNPGDGTGRGDRTA